MISIHAPIFYATVAALFAATAYNLKLGRDVRKLMKTKADLSAALTTSEQELANAKLRVADLENQTKSI